MKIGIIGDTHDRIDTFEKAAKLFRQHGVSLILHHGDWVMPSVVESFVSAMRAELPNVEIKGVLGNNDGDHYAILQRVRQGNLPVEISKDVLELEIGGKKIAVYHGTSEALVNGLVLSNRYDAVFRGHTHVPSVERIGSTLHVNAGTTSFISRGRPAKEATIAIYDTDKNEAHIISFS